MEGLSSISHTLLFPRMLIAHQLHFPNIQPRAGPPIIPNLQNSWNGVLDLERERSIGRGQESIQWKIEGRNWGFAKEQEEFVFVQVRYIRPCHDQTDLARNPEHWCVFRHSLKPINLQAFITLKATVHSTLGKYLLRSSLFKANIRVG